MIALYGQGMHAFVLRELEIGKRAAAAEDDEYCGWSALDDLSYAAYELRRAAGRVVSPQGQPSGDLVTVAVSAGPLRESL